jgi:hypothetical protein
MRAKVTPRRRVQAVAVAGALLTACVPAVHPPPPSPPDLVGALHRFAPVLLQETAHPRWDRPTPFDPDVSGTLADDAEAAWDADAPAPVYTLARADAERLYLFYGLYYPADWSGTPQAPHLDHRGDFEGALVVVARAADAVEAAITQAHGRFYFWCPADLGIASDGRPRLFSEAGGHGLYALLERPWHAKGGTRYPHGPAATPHERLRMLALEIRSFDDVVRHAAPDRARFRGLPRGARPPWFWNDGAIVLDPAAFYAGFAGVRSGLCAGGARIRTW